jgi:hypothetical protein
MQRRRKSAHPRNGRKPSIVPLANSFDLLQGLCGSAYLKIIASVEHCVRSDIERERLLTLDPTAFMDYLHSIASAV